MIGSCNEHLDAVVVYDGYSCPMCELKNELAETQADLEEEMKINAELFKRINDEK